MSLYQFAIIVRSRWIIVASIAASLIAATVILCLVLPKTYEATASVMLDFKQDPVAGTTQLVPGYTGTQVKVIYSQPVAQRVATLLRLDQSPQMQQLWVDSTERKIPFSEWLSSFLQRGLEVEPSRESNVIEVRYQSADPSFAANLANAFAKAYVDTNLQLRVEPAKQYSDFFGARAAQARSDLERAQAKLTAFQREKGLVLTDERMDIENMKLNELSGQLSAMRAMAVDASNRQFQAQGQPEQSPDVIGSPIVQGLRAEILRAEASMQALTARLGEAHPAVVEQRTNLRALQSRLESETKRATGSVSVSTSIVKARESEAQIAYDAQRQRVLKLKEQRDEAQVLEREVESAKRNYEAILARETQTSLESQLNQTNVVLLNKALVPTGHSFPKTFLFVAISAFAGVFLGLCAAFIAEMFDRRLRTGDDIAVGLSLPVLGVMRKPTGIGKLKRREIPWVQRHILKSLPSPASSEPA